MPAIAISLIPAVAVGRTLRSSLITALGSDYVRTARSKGLTERQIARPPRASQRRSARRSAMLGLQSGLMLSGVVVVELVFAWPGIGLYAAQAIPVADFPVIAGVALVIGVAYVVINAIVDVLQAIADPRIRPVTVGTARRRGDADIVSCGHRFLESPRWHRRRPLRLRLLRAPGPALGGGTARPRWSARFPGEPSGLGWATRRRAAGRLDDRPPAAAARSRGRAGRGRRPVATRALAPKRHGRRPMPAAPTSATSAGTTRPTSGSPRPSCCGSTRRRRLGGRGRPRQPQRHGALGRRPHAPGQRDLRCPDHGVRSRYRR